MYFYIHRIIHCPFDLGIPGVMCESGSPAGNSGAQMNSSMEWDELLELNILHSELT